MTTTRAAAATTSRRAKQELVRQLFGSKLHRKGPDAHRQLDHSIYTYDQLRTAYLERVKQLHPDHNPEGRHEFTSLQEAWSNFQLVAKDMGQVDANFTKFGVGCSFADSEAERLLRGEIMDQACRGWFSAGSLGEGLDTKSNSMATNHPVSLCDDDDFVETTEFSSDEDKPRSRRTSLVEAMRKPRRT